MALQDGGLARAVGPITQVMVPGRLEVDAAQESPWP